MRFHIGKTDCQTGTHEGNAERDLRRLIYSAEALLLTFLPESAPGVTMEGFNNMPSNSTLLSARYLKVAAQISSATSAVLQRQHVVSVLAKDQIVNTV